MQFTFETEYDLKGFTTMGEALRKTVRKKRSRRSHILGWFLFVIDLLLILRYADAGTLFSLPPLLNLFLAPILAVVLLFEDKLNGYIALKRTLPGMKRVRAVFGDDGYSSATDLATTEWQYEKIQLAVETDDFFVFLFGKNHGQLYDKRTLEGGTVEEFREFLERKTGEKVVKI